MIQKSIVTSLIVLLICLSVRSVTISEPIENEEQVCQLGGDNKHCSERPEEDCTSNEYAAYNIRVYTIASTKSDGFQRFNRSARIYGVKFETLGMENDWHDKDSIYSGGGYKLNILKRAIKKIKDNVDTLILYTDSYNVMYTQTLDEIGHKFRKTGARILFGAQHFLWPDKSLEDLYPKIESGSRFVNGDMFIGYVSEVKQLLNSSPIRNTDNSQMFITRAYLDEKLRTTLNMKLDHRSDIFQSLHGSINDVLLEVEDGEYFLHNNATATRPSIIQGNGPSGMILNNYGNYLAKAQTNDGCAECEEYLIEFESDSQLPRVALAIFVQKATPFFTRFLESLNELDYPSDKLDLFIYNAYDGYDKEIATFVESKSYNSVKQSLAEDKLDEAMARNLAISHAMDLKSDYIFVVDAEARLDDAQTLRELLEQNRTFIAPMLGRVDAYHSNFWGALSKTGYYARSHDYFKIADETIRGIWNVPYVSSCYLAKKTILPIMSYYASDMDPDMVMCKSLRDKDVFMYVSNQRTFGHLINGDDYEELRTVPDFYTMLSNPTDWERQYIHPDYAGQLLPNVTHKQPCPDVFWFPIVTERFCADLITIMETYGKWSDGTSMDDRLQGGYESVPTRDIHMRQVGLHDIWLEILQRYVRPLQEIVYKGYSNDPPEALVNFVVRYKPTEQPFLKPHLDSSTYTINIALNRAGIDYEGGGCRFIRYNCSVTDTKVGHMLMHPGRLTHYHEGLYVTNGTRYIMVSFVDPE